MLLSAGRQDKLVLQPPHPESRGGRVHSACKVPLQGSRVVTESRVLQKTEDHVHSGKQDLRRASF
jgi:hypothetical protein